MKTIEMSQKPQQKCKSQGFPTKIKIVVQTFIKKSCQECFKKMTLLNSATVYKAKITANQLNKSIILWKIYKYQTTHSQKFIKNNILIQANYFKHLFVIFGGIGISVENMLQGMCWFLPTFVFKNCPFQGSLYFKTNDKNLGQRVFLYKTTTVIHRTTFNCLVAGQQTEKKLARKENNKKQCRIACFQTFYVISTKNFQAQFLHTSYKILTLKKNQRILSSMLVLKGIYYQITTIIL
eukprot:TRINITY_DN7968_c0_g1_i8.p1 TRINITY_DN7968_c0_g1~~TRINITY_DN7968_c0_g1_i8.p1  ORF type:complete len:237 (+),score=-10.86 TRINITY_DN7968_c0_g1_i8:1294-2004(+)